MTSSTEAFFDDLARRGHIPWLEHEHGALRYEVVDGQYIRPWTVRFDDGDVEVSQDESDVDAVMRLDRALFDRAVCGEANLLSAWLRGQINYTGSLELLTQAGRLLPGPPEQKGPAGGKARGDGWNDRL
jgi:hypothetical protein